MEPRQVASMIQQALYEANIPHARSLVSDRVTVSIGMAVISQPVSILPKRSHSPCGYSSLRSQKTAQLLSG